MIEFRSFDAQHLRFLRPQEAQAAEFRNLLTHGVHHLNASAVALSAWRAGRCLGAAGLVQIWPHKATAWALFDKEAGVGLVACARKMKRVIDMSPYSRVEITVAEGFDAGHRFARILGAVCETPEPMRKYGYAGGAETMYAIIKET